MSIHVPILEMIFEVVNREKVEIVKSLGDSIDLESPPEEVRV